MDRSAGYLRLFSSFVGFMHLSIKSVEELSLASIRSGR
jgi:hypothetical protein